MTTKSRNRRQRRAARSRRPAEQFLQFKTVKNDTSPHGLDLLVVENGVTIARRGYPDTPEACTWVSLVPGVFVRDIDGDTIEVRHFAAGHA